MIKKTLVWHQGALGDLLLSLPSIYAIKSSFLNRRLHLVSRTDLAGLILKNGIADNVSSHEEGLFSLLFGSGDLPGKLTDFLDECHSAFIFARRPDPLFLSRIVKCIPATYFIQTVPPDGKVLHVSDFQLQNVRSAGIRPGARMPLLEADSPPYSGAASRIIAVHPGSGSDKKRWPLENYLELMTRLEEYGEYNFRILLGPAEEDGIFRKIVEWADRRDDTAQIVRNMPIPHIAAVLKSSALFAGNDSGITHLASSMGVPTVALFGPTDHRLWGPAGKCAIVVRSGRACSPCGERRYQCREPECLKEIEADSVIEAILRLLKL